MRINKLFQEFSISKKFIIIYITIFAVPIILYASMTFRKAEQEQMNAFYLENVQKMTDVHQQILQKIDICDKTAQLALSNDGFIAFVTSDMRKSGVDLMNFKFSEYQEVQNIVNINPGIYNITFFIDNADIYEMMPLVLHQDRFPTPHLVPRIYALNGVSMYHYDRSQKRLGMVLKNDMRRISLYKKINYVDGFVEVSMLLKDFFEDIFLHHEKSITTYYVIKDGQQIIADEDNPFMNDRQAQMPEIYEKSVLQTGGHSGDIQFSTEQESFYLLYRYIEPLNAYIYQISSIDAMTKILGSTKRQIIIGVLIWIMVLSLITSIVTLLLTNKIRLLRASIRRVESGDLNVAIPVTGNDEVDEVARHFNNMVVRIRDLINRLISKEVAVKDIEIKALQSQINSHFIHNVLEAIRILAILENNHDIARATRSLSNLMRYSMNWEKQLVTLKNETALVESYILLINLISDVKVSFEHTVEDKLLDYKVSKMLIQPVVENAVKHGIQPTGRDGDIRMDITTDSEKGYLYIGIEDNGIGIDENDLDYIRDCLLDAVNEKHDSSKIGLRNVDERIKHFYGEEYGVTIQSEKGVYTKVVLRLPYKENVGGW
ncbi:MAG: histidine kinase [Firmicutes bacterium]|nr:histidine kinase [Bacillota bacterium]